MTPLKHAIDALHREAEQTPFNQRMMRGELTTLEYGQYLFQMYHIFSAIERYPLPHAELARSERTFRDVRAVVQPPVQFRDVYCCDATVQYVTHLHMLSQTELLPHVYLNYMALLFGGQLLKKTTPGPGTMYQFAHPQEMIAAIRAVQQDTWVAEANRGLQHHINIFHELHSIFGPDRTHL